MRRLPTVKAIETKINRVASADSAVRFASSQRDHKRLVITTLVYEINMSGKLKSRMLWIATQSQAFPRAGSSRGKVTFVNVANFDAPLTHEASSSSW